MAAEAQVEIAETDAWAYPGQPQCLLSFGIADTHLLLPSATFPTTFHCANVYPLITLFANCPPLLDPMTPKGQTTFSLPPL